MTKVFCGIDFGTTNSSVAISDGSKMKILSLDESNDLPTSLPSLLYISREGEYIVGRDAANAFIERNVGREVLLKSVDLGISIEGYVGAEPDKSEGYRPRDEISNVREAVRARAMVEVNSPGRLFQSLKTSLRFEAFKGTEIFGTHYQIEELTAIILRQMKASIDAEAGQSVDTAVFGRPVRFSTDPREDEIAEGRLRIAAELAGFKNVLFFYEPVGACVEYAIETSSKHRLMVVDIGGGTCDVCVMEFGGQSGTAARLAESEILGVAGLPIAGDAIDREITRAKLFPRFGSRSRYGPSTLPMPQFVYNTILDWQNIYRLNTEDIIHWLIACEASSNDPEAICALRYLIQKNYGYPVAREVELAKKRLSFEPKTSIDIIEDGILISEELEQSEFAHIIEYELEKMLDCIKDAEANACVEPKDIDCVLTTGGTCLIPAIRHMLEERFGVEKLLERETFTSVAAGLAVVAQYT